MKYSAIIGILLIGFWTPHLRADIYSWTDKDGVVHYTNYNPPKEAKIFLKAPEIIYDENVVQESRRTDELDSYRSVIQKIAEQLTLIAKKQQAIENQLDAANRKAEQVLERSQDLPDETQLPVRNVSGFERSVSEHITDTGYKRSYNSYGYYPYSPYYRYKYNYRHGGFKHRYLKYYRYGKRDYGHRYKRHFRHSYKHRFGHFSKHHGRKFSHGSRYHGFRGKSYHYKGHFRGSHRFKTHFRGGHRFKGHFRGGHRGFRGGRR